MRTLPLRVQPVEGEAVDSWLEALAARMQCAWGDLLTSVGLPAARGRSYNTGWLVDPTQHQLEAMSVVTGQSPSVINTMVLSHIASRLGRSDIPDESVESMLWLSKRRSRFCPACLRENGGRWMLAWRLRWNFSCPRHNCLLADLCPACRSPQRAVPASVALIPIPGRCAHKLLGCHGRGVTRCGTDLSNVPVLRLAPDHPVLRAQQMIDVAVSAGVAQTGLYSRAPVPPSALIADLCALGGRILRYPNLDELRRLTGDVVITEFLTAKEEAAFTDRGVTADSSALASGIAAAAAESILSAGNPAEAADRLQWLISSNRNNGLSVSATNIGWGRGISAALRSAQLSALSSYLSVSDQLRYRTHSTTPLRPHSRSAPERARWLPSLLWPAVCLNVRCDGVGYGQVRSALAVAVVLVGSRISLSGAAALLGSATSARAVSRVLQLIGRSTSAAEVWRMAEGLADQLDTEKAPIDYARRRASSCGDLLPESVWIEICLSSGISPGRGLRLALARCWLYERITGLPGARSPWAIDSAEFRSKLADLPMLLNSEFITAADSYAGHFLAEQAITDEPVVWSPTTLSDFGASSAFGDPVRGHRAEVNLSRRLQESRLACGSVPPGASSGVCAARRRLARGSLEELYVGQRKSLAHIANLYGLSRHMVTQLADSYGIAIRTPGRQPRD
ncbi:MAG: TniQ family protein [Mycobacterium sp.]|nr:TniQ family protein [Mycobacterium sp.]